MTQQEILKGIQEAWNLEINVFYYFKNTYGYKFKPLRRKMEKYSKKGYIDYGVSLNFPWVTEKGRKIISG